MMNSTESKKHDLATAFMMRAVLQWQERRGELTNDEPYNLATRIEEHPPCKDELEILEALRPFCSVNGAAYFMACEWQAKRNGYASVGFFKKYIVECIAVLINDSIAAAEQAFDLLIEQSNAILDPCKPVPSVP